MVIAIEALVVPTGDDEEPCNQEIIKKAVFQDEKVAAEWAWARMEEGYFVRLWRR